MKTLGYFLLLSLLLSCTPKKMKTSMPTTLPPATYSAPETFEIVPGISLGDVNIGETSESLKSKSFSENSEYALSESYLKRSGLNARLYGGKVAQIWVDTEHLSKLRYQGKHLPKTKSAKVLRQFFSGCEKNIQGSGGILVYCENRGLRLEFGFPENAENSFGGLSVVDLADYESVVEKK